jgi:hypothetical protein
LSVRGAGRIEQKKGAIQFAHVTLPIVVLWMGCVESCETPSPLLHGQQRPVSPPKDHLARRDGWRCRAWSRYLYICEDGLVHYCSQQRGFPAKPLAEYTVADIRREYVTKRDCAPFCTVSSVHQISYMDFWRDPQTISSTVPAEGSTPLVQIQSGGR